MSNIESILDRLPIFDGSGRRRFVAGGIILSAIAITNWESLSSFLSAEDEQLGLFDLLANPLLTLASVLLIYTIGGVTELIGELFVQRAASGVRWAVGYPSRILDDAGDDDESKGKKVCGWEKWILVAENCLWSLFVTIMFVAYCLVAGLLGQARGPIEIPKRLLGPFPDSVQEGLRQPVGDKSDMALWQLVNSLSSREGTTWARRQIGRAKEVSTILTAVLITVPYLLLSGQLIGDVRNYEEVASASERLIDAIDDVFPPESSEAFNSDAISERFLRLHRSFQNNIKPRIERGEAIF